VWTRDVTAAHRVARRLRAGTVWINTFDASDVITPFGGVKATGAGRDRSLHALAAYTALKTTWLDLS
jgi:gamma-glutamyl-gamma-aminobutyraldehyde dehydrogenase/4-guanidinobutyraldehyde dehydrogenase/NAD-dependent aldehyde dehydrogenase